MAAVAVVHEDRADLGLKIFLIRRRNLLRASAALATDKNGRCKRGRVSEEKTRILIHGKMLPAVSVF